MILYTVQQGDSLWKIAQRHHVGLDALIAANPQLTDPNSILVGQQINVPGLWPPPPPGPVPAGEDRPDYPFCDRPASGRPCIYTAAAGETLESIAQTFMVPLTHLVYFNLGYGKREALPRGARVVIPGSGGEAPRYPASYQQAGSPSCPLPAVAPDASAPGALPATEAWGGCGKAGRRR